MKILVKAVITGFGLSLGSALYKQLSKRFAFLPREDDEKAKDDDKLNKQDGVTDPGLQSS